MRRASSPAGGAVEKPLYAIPSMAQVRATTHSGLTAVSTFSGCGGSCLGLRMAGFRVLWASEFIPAAAETYRANHDTPLDTRDLRTITAAEILERIGKKPGELDLLEGSPPCASFSVSGKREKHWGEVKRYSDRSQRTDDLFFEYIRLLREMQPRAFVAENVPGLTRGKAVGYFREIIATMRACGYQVAARELRADHLGVPQDRRRLFFVGVRNDVGRSPVFPDPLPYRYTIRDVLPEMAKPRTESFDPDRLLRELPKMGDADFIERGMPLSRDLTNRWLRLLPGTSDDRRFNLSRARLDRPCPTIVATGGNNPATASIACPHEPRKFSIPEMKVLASFPADFTLTGPYRQQWERIGRSVPPFMMRAIATAVRDNILA